MESTLKQLQRKYPHLSYRSARKFCWAPETSEICYNPVAKGPVARWSLLHETGHALLKHESYETDFQLLAMEVAAWEKAQEVAGKLKITIDEEHIQDCLDTYRDWLHKRSLCPSCATKSLQSDSSHYRCFNCTTSWRVTPARFCRTYRAKELAAPLPVFAVQI